MKATDVKKVELEQEENEYSLKGTLFSTIVFVGGGIIIFTIILFAFYLTRV